MEVREPDWRERERGYYNKTRVENEGEVATIEEQKVAWGTTMEAFLSLSLSLSVCLFLPKKR